MSITFSSHEAAVKAVERQFLDWFPYRVSGTIHCTTAGFEPTVAMPAYTECAYAHPRSGFAAPNAGKLFTVQSATTTRISVSGLSAATGNGDELLLLHPCAVHFLTTDGPGRWVVGGLRDGKPFVELEIHGGSSQPYENVGGAANYRADRILDVRLHVPLGQPAPFNLHDRADIAFRDFKQGSLLFEGANPSRRIRNPESSEIKPGFAVTVASYRYWYVVGPGLSA